MPVSGETVAGLRQAGLVNEQEGLTEQQRAAIEVRESLDFTISILEGVGQLCTDIDELITMLELAKKNDSQLYLIIAHMAPKKMRVMK